MPPVAEERPYEITFKDCYVEIRQVHAFEITKTLSRSIWREALALCRLHHCSCILRTGPAPIRQMSADQLQEGGACLDMPGLKVAWCWHDYRPDQLDAGFADNAMTLGVTVRHFCSEAEAVSWLCQSVHKSTEER